MQKVIEEAKKALLDCEDSEEEEDSEDQQPIITVNKKGLDDTQNLRLSLKPTPLSHN
jgi:hypothetical protein